MPNHINYYHRRFSRRATMPYYRAGSRPRYHATRSVAAGKIQSAWRRSRWGKRPNYSNTKSVRSVNQPNSQRFRGNNMVQGHKFIGSFNNKMLKGLTGTGILEKRLIKHTIVDYDSPQDIATDNAKLRSSSGLSILYSSKDLPAIDNATNTGIPAGFKAGAFALSGTPSQDKYIFYKNFRTEITITTEASSFAGAPDPTQATQLGYVNSLNFRVLLLKKKTGLQVGNPSGVPFPADEPSISNSLFLGYGNNPYGLTRQYGDTTSVQGNAVAPIDLQMGKINKGMWQVLQDKQFPLSVPVANVAGAESKYPNMKKLIFSHKINEKVLVSTATLGTEPLNWSDRYICLIFASLPNSSNATLGGATALLPKTSRLWKVSARGFTSYLDA